MLCIYNLSVKNLIKTFGMACLAIGLASCVENSPKYKELQAQLDSLQGNYGTQKNLLDDVFATLNRVENGLKTIRQTENILTVETNKDGVDIPQEQKVRLQSDIDAVQEAIKQYKSQIEQLKKDNSIKSVEYKKRLNAIQKELDEKSATITKLSNLLAEKEEIILQKEQTIDSLGQTIQGLQEDVTNLSSEGERLKNKIDTQDRALYAAYYIIGSKDDLIKSGVLSRGGLFRSAKVEYQAEQNAFIKIDYREISVINTNAGKAKVLSNHPKETYSIDNVNGEAIITISNPQGFWEQTKYLVIQVQ
ncbi:MAG: hypothetical protein IKI67_04140 [Bacteroidales bacterium]|nr:hypothetical protein [Bacteroidales bacterium]